MNAQPSPGGMSGPDRMSRLASGFLATPHKLLIGGDDLDRIARMANDTEYGLSSYSSGN